MMKKSSLHLQQSSWSTGVTQTKLGKNDRIYWSTGHSLEEATPLCLLIFCRRSGWGNTSAGTLWVTWHSGKVTITRLVTGDFACDQWNQLLFEMLQTFTTPANKIYVWYCPVLPNESAKLATGLDLVWVGVWASSPQICIQVPPQSVSSDCEFKKPSFFCLFVIAAITAAGMLHELTNSLHWCHQRSIMWMADVGLTWP